MSPSQTDVLILAGGLGTRIRPVLKDRQKIIAPVMGIPFLFYLLSYLSKQGFRRVILLVGYQAHLVRSVVGNEYRGLQIEYSIEEQPLGTSGAVRNSIRFIHSPVSLILNGDSFCVADYSKLIRLDRASILVTPVPDISRFGSVDVDHNNLVCSFNEKRSCSQPGLINAGVYSIPTEYLQMLPAGRASLESDFLPMLVTKRLLYAVYGGRFIDIGTPQSYYEAQRFFSEGFDDVAV
jgi:D-glycero-alpha-D-manno-heptose 1-phosphate guanylyltransferase